MLPYHKVLKTFLSIVMHEELVWVSVLIQNENVIHYASIKLNVHEKNYPTNDLELTVVLCVLKIWRYYLYGFHADVITNHKILPYMFTQMILISYK